MPELRVWTLVARHPLHTDDQHRPARRQAKLEIDEPREFLPHLLGIAKAAAPAHTTDHPDTWIQEWELEVYREPDDLDPYRIFRYANARGAAA